MKNKATILHIVGCDKFTNGYINYMNIVQSKYNHYFVYVKRKGYKIIEDEERIIPISGINKIYGKKIIKIMNNADKVIISGVFGIQITYAFLPKKILNKTYLQFWGGDFYCYRDINKFSKMYLKKVFTQKCIKNCAGIINLIPDDYEELCKIFPNNKKHFVGEMPGDPKEKRNYADYFMKVKNSKIIIIGNSATPENHHIEVFKMLEHLKNENIKIICPLSYGDKNYSKEVIKTGKEIFQDKFKAIEEFMEFNEYIKLLSKCDIGIFYNDRQQAMGNILALICMGKKLYLREGTTMWKEYKRHNIIINSADKLKDVTYEELFYMPDEIRYENLKNMEIKRNYYNNCWNDILND